MKLLIRLYPRRWRARYGGEMEDLLDRLPSRPAMAIDLLFGAARVYVDVIRADRLLSTAGAFVHGASVAVLLQAIAFLALVLIAQGLNKPADIHLGPFHLVTVGPLLIREFNPYLLHVSALHGWMSSPGIAPAALMAALLAALVIVLASPRLWRVIR
jgi:ABC-type transporter Mla maintaining outer membrane lipid asymmetry permease subunit MlaE